MLSDETKRGIERNMAARLGYTAVGFMGCQFFWQHVWPQEPPRVLSLMYAWYAGVILQCITIIWRNREPR